jgi:hypothetical protein
VGDDEPFYEKILEDFGIELSDFWDGEPFTIDMFGNQIPHIENYP